MHWPLSALITMLECSFVEILTICVTVTTKFLVSLVSFLLLNILLEVIIYWTRFSLTFLFKVLCKSSLRLALLITPWFSWNLLLPFLLLLSKGKFVARLFATLLPFAKWFVWWRTIDFLAAPAARCVVGRKLNCAPRALPLLRQVTLRPQRTIEALLPVVCALRPLDARIKVAISTPLSFSS